MGWGNHHLEAYDPDIGRSREFTADELQAARGRSLVDGYRHMSVDDAANDMRNRIVMLEAELNRLKAENPPTNWTPCPRCGGSGRIES